MKVNAVSKFSRHLGCAAMALVVSAAVASPAAYARSVNDTVLVPPMDLPDVARQTGEAMFLHQAVDGRTLLYVERNQGSALAILDVTDPRHIKGEGTVPLDAPGPFDFVSAFGEQAELIRFRQGQDSAVLDLHKLEAPTLTDRGLRSQAQSLPQFVSTNSQQLNTALDGQPVTAEVANNATGTTFLLTERGVSVIRRPDVEMIAHLRELNYSN
jgi:hypothetical protein